MRTGLDGVGRPRAPAPCLGARGGGRRGGARASAAPVTLRTNTCRTTSRRWSASCDAGGRPRPSAARIHPGLAPGRPAGRPARCPASREGWFAVQDQASSFVVRALDPRPGDRVLDACAGPGGKAGHLACAGRAGGTARRGGRPRRRGRARAGRPSTGSGSAVTCSCRTVAGRRSAAPFDRILVDAPCSGIGSARRRPELLWRARRDELVGARPAAGRHRRRPSPRLLRPGGRLVYSVCTFPRAETDAACDAHPAPRRPTWSRSSCAGPDGPAARIRLWPHRHGCDAMFVAGFRRRARALAD